MKQDPVLVDGNPFVINGLVGKVSLKLLLNKCEYHGPEINRFLKKKKICGLAPESVSNGGPN